MEYLCDPDTIVLSDLNAMGLMVVILELCY